MIVVGHFIGAIVAALLINELYNILQAFLSIRLTERNFVEYARIQGYEPNQLDDDTALLLIRKLYGSRLFANRFANFIGRLTTIFGWCVNGLEVIIVLTVAYLTYAEGQMLAVYVWLIVGTSLIFIIVNTVLGSICRLLTGRTIGEPLNGLKLAQKDIAAFRVALRS